MRYWYLSKSRMAGPLDIAELRKKPGFSFKTKVCPENLPNEDAKNWKLAGDIAEFSYYSSASAVEISQLEESVKNSREGLLEFKQTTEDFLNAQKANMAHYQTLTQDFTKELQATLEKLLSSLEKLALPAAVAPPTAPQPAGPLETASERTPQTPGVRRTIPIIPPISATAVPKFYREKPEKSEPALEIMVKKAASPASNPDILISMPDSEDKKPAPKKAPLKILVADDEEVLRYMYSLMLAEYHFEIIQAASGNEALELAEKHNPDIIFLDHNMPDMKGYETIERLRKQPKFRMTPICLITGNDFDKDFRDWIKMEVQEFVAKPFTADDINNAVAKSLKFIEQNKRG